MTCWNRQEREYSGKENQGRKKREEIQEDKWIHSHLDYSYWDHLSIFSGHWFWLRQLRNGKWRNGGYSRSFALQWLTNSSEHSGGNGISLRWKRISPVSADSGPSVCVRVHGWHPSKTTNGSQIPPKTQTSLRPHELCRHLLQIRRSITLWISLQIQGSANKDQTTETPAFVFNPVWAAEPSDSLNCPTTLFRGHLNWDLWTMDL